MSAQKRDELAGHFPEELKIRGLKIARDIADWICNISQPWEETFSAPGTIPFSVNTQDWRVCAPSWNYAFAFMGLAGSYRYFKDERYKTYALRLARILKSFQILDPFSGDNYGAMHEYSPLCPWCYTRDAISAGWGFIEMYRFTGDAEYLERAKIFGQWLLRKGLDGEGYPWFGVQLEQPFHQSDVGHIKNDVQGNFQGGSLNYFYQMLVETGDGLWVESMKKIADIFVDHVQQESGFYVSIFRDTKKPVSADDPYAVLHRGNDDLGSIGLLCAYKATGEKKYLESAEKFLKAVWANQRKDGFFENSVAASPVVLNATYEAAKITGKTVVGEKKIALAISAMLGAQCEGEIHPALRGALIENVSNPREVTMRANCYALIMLLKYFGNISDYLCA